MVMTIKEKRLVDANLNRLKEGIRVVEDIFRYIFDNKQIASRLKELRHLAIIPNYTDLLNSRDIKNDVLKQTTKSEATRNNLNAILLANFKRSQESARVLEEFTKLISSEISTNFKYIRYELYDIEKELINL
jgi:thiamine-phosphate pyrophosphorylase